MVGAGAGIPARRPSWCPGSELAFGPYSPTYFPSSLRTAAPSPRMAWATARFSRSWHFNDPFPDFRIRSWKLRGLRDASPGISFSGPLIANKLYLSQGAEYNIAKTAVRTLPFPFNESKTEPGGLADGLATSTVLNLFVLPVLSLRFARFSRRQDV